MKNRNLQRTVATLVFALMATYALPANGQDEIALGSQLPMADRSMSSSTGESLRLADLSGSAGLVLVFWSNECPWVDKYEDRMSALISRFQGAGYGFALINANDPIAFPVEGPAGSRERSQSRRYAIPYLLDDGSALAKALGATRTPHVYVFGADRSLVYSGAFDDSPGDPGNVTESYVADVLQAGAQGTRAGIPRTTAFGCRIKFVQ